MRVGFGEREAFNKTIAVAIDSQRFQHDVVDLRTINDFSEFDFVVPLTIGEVLWLGANCSESNFRKFAVPHPAVVKLADDKAEFNSFLRSKGHGNLLPANGKSPSFPYVIKRRRDSGGKHSTLICDRKEAESWKHLLNDPDYFWQQYVAGDIEYTSHILYHNGIKYSCTIEFRMNRELYIRGVRMQPFENVQMSIVSTPFVSIFDDILSTMNFSGLCCFNYKIVDDLPVIFELNPRYGGSLSRDINNLLDAIGTLLN